MDPQTFERRQKNFEEYRLRQNEMKAQIISKKLRANSSGSLSRERVAALNNASKTENMPWTMTKEEWEAKMTKAPETEKQIQEEQKVE